MIIDERGSFTPTQFSSFVLLVGFWFLERIIMGSIVPNELIEPLPKGTAGQLLMVCCSPQLGWSVLQIPPEVVFANVSRRIAIQRKEVIGTFPSNGAATNEKWTAMTTQRTLQGL